MKRFILILGGIGSAIFVALALWFVRSSAEATRAHASESATFSAGSQRISSAKESETVLTGRAVTRAARSRTTPLLPQSHMDTAAVVAETPEPATITEEAVRVWAETDPEGAADHLLRLPPGPERTALLLALAAVWAEAAPEKAAAKLLKTIVTSEELALAGEIAAAWARSAPLQALSWLGAKDMPEDLRLITVGHLYAQWAEVAPETAAAHALLSGGGVADETLGAALARWLDASAPSALDWFRANVAEAQRARLAPQVAVALAQQDEADAERFLCEQQECVAWPAIARDAAYALASTHPTLAERLAETLDNRAEQERILSRIRRLSSNAASDEEASGAAP